MHLLGAHGGAEVRHGVLAGTEHGHDGVDRQCVGEFGATAVATGAAVAVAVHADGVVHRLAVGFVGYVAGGHGFYACSCSGIARHGRIWIGGSARRWQLADGAIQ